MERRLLEFGMGSVTLKGDWRLSLVGALLVVVVAAVHVSEVYYEGSEKKSEKPSEEDEESLLESKEVTSETTSIQAQKAPVSNTYAALSGLAVMACSVSLVYTNAWVLARFPHVATYITIQQGSCFVLAVIAVKGFQVVKPIEMPLSTYATRVAPLGVCFTIYLWGSNTAYKYLQPGLIQMIKPIGSCFVFAHACALGVERYTRPKALNFVIISCGTLLTAAPELLRGVGGVQGSTSGQIVFGVSALVGAYFCDAYYVVGIQRLHEGQLLDRNFDPLSTLMYVSPIATLCLALVSAATERAALADLPNFPFEFFLASSLLAFSFNLAVMNFIGRLSATTYVVFDYLKDLIILSLAFFLFSEHFARNELVGYAVVVVGAASWQHRKLRHLAYAQHNITATARALAKSPTSALRCEKLVATAKIAADDDHRERRPRSP
mmetsp:Transcript_12886/g.40890  ORF Transcript_12886/g.40890 Transcript_12886/m.40890 type:complete len:436 (+) Transcript_12886:80-1387(+)|eukprot:CAMPEP_0197409008 /NCGR_PEP_ID=MMETSP1165-20131217/29258_1 /TAXON_ID=284809 /ORGANISM="Chrysocystis fragilis, Strain CCMP3189" /LENGTH=435 /DNA_ID=CAMNT_0042935451 /DNA_START=25 /DNA_END=1332 /DNA_ORIENTATION=-